MTLNLLCSYNQAFFWKDYRCSDGRAAEASSAQLSKNYTLHVYTVHRVIVRTRRGIAVESTPQPLALALTTKDLRKEIWREMNHVQDHGQSCIEKPAFSILSTSLDSLFHFAFAIPAVKLLFIMSMGVPRPRITGSMLGNFVGSTVCLAGQVVEVITFALLNFFDLHVLSISSPLWCMTDSPKKHFMSHKNWTKSLRVSF